MYSRKPNSVNKINTKNNQGGTEYFQGRRGTVQLGQNPFGQNIPSIKKNIDENNQTSNSKCKF
jgi:hypothetical protein